MSDSDGPAVWDDVQWDLVRSFVENPSDVRAYHNFGTRMDWANPLVPLLLAYVPKTEEVPPLAAARIWLALHMRFARIDAPLGALMRERVFTALEAIGPRYVRDRAEPDWTEALEEDDADAAVCVLRSDAALYHATHGDITAAHVLRRDNFFADWATAVFYFAADYDRHHENGAAVHRFRVQRRLRLLALDRAAAWREVAAHVDPALLELSFPLSGDGTIHRRWDFGNDRRLMQQILDALPSLRLDGVAVPTELPIWDDPDGGVSPPELWLKVPAAALEATGEALLPAFEALM